MIKGIIFDMDGTLLDTEIIWHEAWKKADEYFNLQIEEDVLKRFIGMPKQEYDEIIDDILPKNSNKDEIADFRIKYFNDKYQRNGIDIKKGVLELLDYLKNKQCKLAVCTSTYSYRTIPWLKNAGLYDYFDVIVCGELVKKGKPDPEIYQITMNKLNLDAKSCIAFEDSEYGIRSAVKAGIKTYFIKDINDISENTRNLIEKELDCISDAIEFL